MVAVSTILRASLFTAISAAAAPSVGFAQGMDGSWSDNPGEPAPKASPGSTAGAGEPPPVREAEVVADDEEAPKPTESPRSPEKKGAAQGKEAGKESAAEPEPGAHLHDGFYLSGSLGGGYLRTNEEFQGQALVARGGGVAFDFALGGTIAPGLVLGVGVGARAATSPKYELDGVSLSPTEDAAHSQSSLYLLLDWYPEPERGLHVFGTFGWAAAEVDPYRTTETIETGYDDDFESETTTLTYASDYARHASGYSYGLGLGYNFWVSRNWSIGPVAQIQAVSLKDRDTHAHVDGWAWSLGAQFAYH